MTICTILLKHEMLKTNKSKMDGTVTSIDNPLTQSQIGLSGNAEMQQKDAK